MEFPIASSVRETVRLARPRGRARMGPAQLARTSRSAGELRQPSVGVRLRPARRARGREGRASRLRPRRVPLRPGRRIGRRRGWLQRSPLARPGTLPWAKSISFVNDPFAYSPVPLRTVVMGMVGTHRRTIPSCSAPAPPRALAVDPNGMFLAVLPGRYWDAHLRIVATVERQARGRVPAAGLQRSGRARGPPGAGSRSERGTRVGLRRQRLRLRPGSDHRRPPGRPGTPERDAPHRARRVGRRHSAARRKQKPPPVHFEAEGDSGTARCRGRAGTRRIHATRGGAPHAAGAHDHHRACRCGRRGRHDRHPERCQDAPAERSRARADRRLRRPVLQRQAHRHGAAAERQAASPSRSGTPPTCRPKHRPNRRSPAWLQSTRRQLSQWQGPRRGPGTVAEGYLLLAGSLKAIEARIAFIHAHPGVLPEG